MAEIVNLRMERKRRKRQVAESQAQENRIRHGISGAERKLEKARRGMEADRHAGHLLDGAKPDPGKRP